MIFIDNLYKQTELTLFCFGVNIFKNVSHSTMGDIVAHFCRMAFCVQRRVML